MARRPGFTIVELLVSVAILAILAAVIIPVVGSLRAMALRVVCTSRLKDLTLACNMHRTEKGAYPVQPGTTLSPQLAASAGPADAVSPAPPGLASVLPAPKPTDMDPSFLNVLQPYMGIPALDAGVQPGDVPHILQSPTVEDADDGARQVTIEFTFSKPALYTGYAYCVRPKDGTLAPGVKLLKRNAVASPREEGRRVLWADDVQWSMAEYAWSFSHPVPRAKRANRPLMFSERSGLLGQHRAFTDGSVEWVHGADIDLEINGQYSKADKKASLSVSDLFYFWF